MKKCYRELHDELVECIKDSGAMKTSVVANPVLTDKSIDCILIYFYLKNEKDVYFIFTNMFKVFSDYFANSSLDDKTVAEVMFDLVYERHAIKTSIVGAILPDFLMIAKDMKKLGCGNFSLADAISDDAKLGNLCETIGEFLETKGPLRKNFVTTTVDNRIRTLSDYTLRDKYVYNGFAFRNAVEKIISSYSFNRTNYDESVINDVKEAFETLSVNEVVVDKIVAYLTDKMNKNNQKIEERKTKTFVSKPKFEQPEKKSDLITDKEYRSILKEIRSVFNPYTLELVSEVDPDKRAYIAGLMARIDLDEQVIKRFLQLTGEEKSYTYEYFSSHVDEFKYYYEEELDDIFAYLEEVYASLNEDDKTCWIDMINEELRKHMFDFKLGSYDYEFKKLKGM